MRSMRWLAGFLVVLLLAAGASVARAARESSSWDQYKVLVTRNIFARVRGERTRTYTPRTTLPRRPEASPESYIRFRGTMSVSGAPKALLEEVRSGNIITAGVGDKLLQGTIAKVGLDSMTYTRDDAEIQILIGESLAKGHSPGPVETGTGTTPTVTGTGTGATPAPAGSAAEILERLRQKRMKELGQ